MPESFRVPKKLFGMLKIGHNGLKLPPKWPKNVLQNGHFWPIWLISAPLFDFYDGIIGCYHFLCTVKVAWVLKSGQKIVWHRSISTIQIIQGYSFWTFQIWVSNDHFGAIWWAALGHLVPCILSMPNNFLGTLKDSGNFHCAQKIITNNYPIIKCQIMELKWAKLVKNEGHF